MNTLKTFKPLSFSQLSDLTHLLTFYSPGQYDLQKILAPSESRVDDESSCYIGFDDTMGDLFPEYLNETYSSDKVGNYWATVFMMILFILEAEGA